MRFRKRGCAGVDLVPPRKPLMQRDLVGSGIEAPVRLPPTPAYPSPWSRPELSADVINRAVTEAVPRVTVRRRLAAARSSRANGSRVPLSGESISEMAYQLERRALDSFGWQVLFIRSPFRYLVHRSFGGTVALDYDDERRPRTMFYRLATLAAVCMLVSTGTAPLAAAEPDPNPPPVPVANAGPPPDTGAVPSEQPGIVTTPDGWQLTVAALNETQLPVAPLTTALSSREYLVGATFTGSITGSGDTTLDGGKLEVGYQIGCGIELERVRLAGQIGIGTSGSTLAGLVPTGASLPISGTFEVQPKPGEVTTVSVTKKKFKAQDARVTVKDVHIKIDGCVGQSFLRSFAVLTSSTADTNDIVAYYGVTKTV